MQEIVRPVKDRRGSAFDDGCSLAAPTCGLINCQRTTVARHLETLVAKPQTPANSDAVWVRGRGDGSGGGSGGGSGAGSGNKWLHSLHGVIQITAPS